MAAVLETPLGGAPPSAGLPIKSWPELQKILAEDPETAQDLPQPLSTGTMKMSAAALAVVLAAAAFCAPAAASPCKSRSWPPGPESDPLARPDLALFSTLACMLSEPYGLHAYLLLFPDVQLSLIDL